MSQPFVGEIRMFAGNFAPAGWEFCHGQLLAISENEVLFQLIGTTYGGDGESTFALPDLQSRVPIHAGTGGGGSYILAETGGAETVTLSTNQIPAHSHQVLASTDVPTLSSPANAVTGAAATKLYRVPGATAQMSASTLAPTGGSQPHENMQPYLVINYIISMFGIFPNPT
ncbi:MAG TPA: tail fiber protein [Kofleriaceae bacterium]|nr:tail fiber protein [Kofleriaceae bacterium]